MRHRPLIVAITITILGLIVVTAGLLVTIDRYNYEYRGVAYGADQTTVNHVDELPYGVNVDFLGHDPAAVDAALSVLQSHGCRWLRQPFPWRDAEPSPGLFNWEAFDTLVDQCQAHHMSIIAILDGPPDWPRQDPDYANSPPRENRAYGDFVAAFAARYRDRVDHLQIWDEPNIFPNWGWHYADPAAYTALLHEAYSRAKAANPQAVILTAALAPNVETGGANLSDLLFLQEMYRHGARGSFDVVAAEPYGLWNDVDDRRVDAGLVNFSRVVALREVMVNNGDERTPIWAVEFGWNALPAGWSGQPSIWGEVSETQQAAETVRAFQRARDEWPWMGVMCVQGFFPWVDADDPSYGFSVVDRDLKPRPVLAAIQELATGEQYAGVGYHPITDQRLGWTGATPGQHQIIPFSGTALDLAVVPGPTASRVAVSIDGGASYSVEIPATLSSPERIRLASGLEDGLHHADIAIEATTPGADSNLTATIVGLYVVRDSLPWGYYLLFATLVGTDLVLLRRLWLSLNAPAARAFWASMAARVLAAATGVRQRWQLLPEPVRDGLLLALGAASIAGICLSLDWRVIAGAALVTLALTWWRFDLSLGLLLLTVPFYLAPFKYVVADSRPLVSPIEVIIAAGAVVWVLQRGLRAVSLNSVFPWRPIGSSPKDPGDESASRAPGMPAERVSPRASRFGWIGQGAISLSSTDVAIALFVLVSLASLFVTSSPRESLRELRTVIIEPVVFYYLVVTTMRGRQVSRLVNMLLIGAAAVSLFGLAQNLLTNDVITADGVRRMKAFYGSPNNLALYLGRIIPLAICLAIWSSERWFGQRWLYLVAGVTTLPALVLTFSVGGWLGVGAALVVVAVLQGRRALIALGGVAGAALVSAVPLLSSKRVASHLSLDGGTTAVRLDLWQSALAMIRDHPLFGLGLDQFLVYYPQYMLPSAWREPNLSHPHNLVLDFWLRLGIAGLAIIVWLLFSFFRQAYRLYRRETSLWKKALALGLMASMVDFLVHGMIDNSYFVVDLAVVFWFTLATLRIVSRERGLA